MKTLPVYFRGRKVGKGHFDGPHFQLTEIHDAEAMALIRSGGMREISMGYSARNGFTEATIEEPLQDGHHGPHDHNGGPVCVNCGVRYDRITTPTWCDKFPGGSGK